MDKDPKITETAEETEGQNTESETPSATRRRVLKAGAVGVPLVVTLRSGTAWANSAMTCADKVDFPTENEVKVDQSLTDSQKEQILAPLNSYSSGEYENTTGQNLYLEYARSSCYSSVMTQVNGA